MKTIKLITLYSAILVGAIHTANLHAGGIAGKDPVVPKTPNITKPSIDDAKIAALCGPGWKTVSAGAGAPSDINFKCIPVKPKIQCPGKTDLIEDNCSIGCKLSLH